MPNWSAGRTGWNARGQKTARELRAELQLEQEAHRERAVALCYQLIDIMGEVEYNKWVSENVLNMVHPWSVIADIVAKKIEELTSEANNADTRQSNADPG